MKKNIHPKSYPLSVECSKCHNTFTVTSTLNLGSHRTERCLNCLPMKGAANLGQHQGQGASAKQKWFHNFRISDSQEEAANN
jgi:ribosomal protein L31